MASYTLRSFNTPVAHTSRNTLRLQKSRGVSPLFRSARSRPVITPTRTGVETRALLGKPEGYEGIHWKDLGAEVRLSVPIAPDVSRRDIQLKWFPSRIDLKIKGKDILAGKLEQVIDEEECIWSIEGEDEDRELELILTKKGYDGPWEAIFEEDVKTRGSEEVVDECWMDISIGDKPAGRIIFGLFGNAVPLTSENFRVLCEGTTGKSYKNSRFHRIIPEFMVQGGDIEFGDGTGGESIYGSKFDDEDFTIKHHSRGLLSMANAGPNTNGSQFFITSVPCPHLDGKHVVFGKVLEGLEVLEAMEAVGSAPEGTPSEEVKVTACGQIQVEGSEDPQPMGKEHFVYENDEPGIAEIDWLSRESLLKDFTLEDVQGLMDGRMKDMMSDQMRQNIMEEANKMGLSPEDFFQGSEQAVDASEATIDVNSDSDPPAPKKSS